MTDEAQRAKADYWDVWSGIFQNSFFGEQAAWCAKYNVEYLVHLNHEETMMALVRSEGDYFRDNRNVQVPGIDNLGQLVPAAIHTPDGTWRINNNFPKIASSAAHLFGKPKVWTESAGGPGVDGKFQLDFQTGEGGDRAADPPPGWARSQRGGISGVATGSPSGAVCRSGRLSDGHRTPGRAGGPVPSRQQHVDGRREADRSTTKLGWQLFEHQVDWDYFDEQSLSSVAAIADGGFKNLSGQVYRAIVVPSSTVITRTGLERFQAFVKAGGKLISWARLPRWWWTRRSGMPRMPSPT